VFVSTVICKLYSFVFSISTSSKLPLSKLESKTNYQSDTLDRISFGPLECSEFPDNLFSRKWLNLGDYPIKEHSLNSEFDKCQYVQISFKDSLM